MNAPTPEHRDGPKPASPEEELRQQLFELDNRFSLLGGAGLFDTLDRAGVLEHRVEEVGDIDYAMSHPPPVGRARARGEFVRAASRVTGAFACDWMSLWDGETRRQAILADPFCDEPEWCGSPRCYPHIAPSLEHGMSSRLEQIRRLCQTGSYTQALEALDLLEARVRCAGPMAIEEFLYVAAYARSRCGLPSGVEALDELAGRAGPGLGLASLGVKVHMHLGLVPPPGAALWLQRGEELLARLAHRDPRSTAEFLSARAAFLNRSGRAAEALDCGQRALPCLEAFDDLRCLLACTLARLGESHRLLGQRRAAWHALRRAQQLQTVCGFKPDLGRRTTLYRAKLERSPLRARCWLARAEQVLQGCGDRVGLLKTWLLLARVAANPPACQPLKAAIERLRDQMSAFQSCPKLGQILEHWDAWCSGQPCPDGATERFWNI